MTLPQWNRPEPVTTFDWTDFVNDTVIWVHAGLHERVKTQQYGEKQAARGSLIVLSGRYAGEVFDDRLVFGTRLLSQFRAMQPGTFVLGRMVKSGQSVSMDPGAAYDEQLANQWVSAYPGRIEAVVRDALANFAERAREMANGPVGQSSAPPPAQWQAPQAQPPAYPQPQAQPGYGPPAQPGAPAYMPQPTYPPLAAPPAMPAQAPPQQYGQPGSAPAQAPYAAPPVPQAQPAAPDAHAAFQGAPGFASPPPAEPAGAGPNGGAVSPTLASMTSTNEPPPASVVGY